MFFPFLSSSASLEEIKEIKIITQEGNTVEGRKDGGRWVGQSF